MFEVDMNIEGNLQSQILLDKDPAMWETRGPNKNYSESESSGEEIELNIDIEELHKVIDHYLERAKKRCSDGPHARADREKLNACFVGLCFPSFFLDLIKSKLATCTGYLSVVIPL